jgi:hypothetical protein
MKNEQLEAAIRLSYGEAKNVLERLRGYNISREVLDVIIEGLDSVYEEGRQSGMDAVTNNYW